MSIGSPPDESKRDGGGERFQLESPVVDFGVLFADSHVSFDPRTKTRLVIISSTLTKYPILNAFIQRRPLPFTPGPWL